jgi:hypothetical protein
LITFVSLLYFYLMARLLGGNLLFFAQYFGAFEPIFAPGYGAFAHHLRAAIVQAGACARKSRK